MKKDNVSRETSDKRYWLIPTDIYDKLNKEFGFTFDPCPCPCPDDYNGVDVEWGESNFVNPPFRSKDKKHGAGITAFIRKAIEEAKKGKTSVFTIPCPSYMHLLIKAGAELRDAGRIRWLEVDSKEPMPGPGSSMIAIIKPSEVTDAKEE
jgi:hypothetical protein